MTHFRLAWLDLLRHKGATVLALLSLGLTVGCVGILLRLNILAESRFGEMAVAGDALVGAKAGQVEMLLGCMNLEGAYPGFIPARLYQTLLSQDKVGFADAVVNTRLHRLIVPMVFCGKLGSYRLIGTTEAFLHQPEPGPHVILAEGNWVGAQSEVVLGAEVASRKKLAVGDDVLVSNWTSDEMPEPDPAAHRMKVAGVLSRMGNAWDRALFTDLPEAKRIFTTDMPGDNTVWGKDVLQYLIVYLRPGGMEPLRTLINQRTVAQVVDVNEARNSLEALTGTGRRMGVTVISLVLALSALSISGLMIARLEAKSKQLTVLRAIGFTQKELLTLVILEGLLLGLGALAIGIPVDNLLFPFFRSLLGTNLPSPLEMSVYPWQSWPVWISSFVATQFSALIPLLRFNLASPRESLQNLSG